MLFKIIHIIGALAILISTGGLRINSHYCENEFVKNSLYFSLGSCCTKDQPDECSTEKSKCSHDERDAGEEEEEGCCSTTTNIYVLDQDQKVQLFQFKSFAHLDVWNTFIVAHDSELSSIDEYIPEYLKYFPPQIVFDRQERFQIFLC